MTNIDQFESVFRGAQRSAFHYRPPAFARVLLVSDLADDPGQQAADFEARARSMLQGLFEPAPTWQHLQGDSIASLQALVHAVEGINPDLICTYRHLNGDGWRWPFGLGASLDVLTQVCRAPVLVLPHPSTPAGQIARHAPSSVMLMTDHLDGSQGPVNAAARFTRPHGTLWLTHVEDQAAFEHVMDAIAKIPAIDTDTVRRELPRRLLDDPLHYADLCRRVLASARADLKVEHEIIMGRHLASYRQLVDRHSIDLLVMNTKDDEQVAMHGLAYPLAVELRELPLLLL